MAQKPKRARGASTASRSGDDTVVVDILTSREQWSEFDLADGSKIRLKPVVVEVRRHKRKYTDSGDPLYEVKSAMIFDTRAPDKLRKKQRSK